MDDKFREEIWKAVEQPFREKMVEAFYTSQSKEHLKPHKDLPLITTKTGDNEVSHILSEMTITEGFEALISKVALELGSPKEEIYQAFEYAIAFIFPRGESYIKPKERWREVSEKYWEENL